MYAIDKKYYAIVGDCETDARLQEEEFESKWEAFRWLENILSEWPKKLPRPEVWVEEGEA